MFSWQVVHQVQRRCDCMLVTLLATEGSTPQNAGARMLVWRDGIHGTIGGGNLEHQVVQKARAMLRAKDGVCAEENYVLGASFGQCCGGRIKVGFAVLKSPSRLIVFGAGHVGLELARLASRLPVDCLIYDTVRKELDFTGLDRDILHINDDLPAIAQELASEAWVLVMTHDHSLDFQLVETLLRKKDRKPCFLGLIGSQSKRARFMGRLRRRGLDEKECSHLVCPLEREGATQAGRVSKDPAAVAVCIMATLIEHGMCT